MKRSHAVTFVEEGKWTPGADATLIIGDWQAWVDGEGHWKVRGPDPDNAAHYADGDIELTETEYIEAGNSEARRKIRAQRAKKAARAYIQSMARPSRARLHATKKRSPAQLQHDIDEALAARSGLSKHHRYLLSQRKPSGALGAGYLTPAGWHGDPLTIEDPKLRLVALREQPSPRLPRSKQHSSIAKEQTSSNAPSLHVGQQFDHFGHIYEITKIGRDKNRTVQIARRHRDLFGKEAFIDQRSFPARHFDQQHLRPITSHATIKTFDAPKPSLSVRQINAIVRAADGRNIYLIRHRLDEETVQRVTRARTREREMEVRSLSTGNWLPVLPERGDRLEVR